MGYFDLYLDLSHGEEEAVTVWRNVYYRNMILFVQRVRDPVAFKIVDAVKANLTTLFHGAFFEWYTLEVEESDRDDLKKTPGMEK